MKKLFCKLRRYARKLAPIWLILMGCIFSINGMIDFKLSELLIGLLCAALGVTDKYLLRKKERNQR